MSIKSLYFKLKSGLKLFTETYIATLFEIRTRTPLHVFAKTKHYGRPVVEILYKARSY